MKYLSSQVDKDNLGWFSNDMTVQSLSEIQLREGQLRGLGPFEIKFTYPISAIAGKNRSGKSTILAMAACAFHNSDDGFRLPERKASYYTFSDFFVQSSEEVPPQGIKILYRIMHDHWKISSRSPTGVGNLFQVRSKKRGGKWSKYARRVKRNVIFFGVQRVVPPSEKSVSRSYRSLFSDQGLSGWEDAVKDTVGRILGTTYDSFKMKTYGKYRLPVVANEGTQYSGFNMGAGENALFEIFSMIYATPRGTLLVIDEIELGLHTQAQKRLINELKDTCKQRHIQVICTTHSPTILETLPPEACFYVECLPSGTIITPSMSPLYAAGSLSGEKSRELDIYVEDGVAKYIVEAFMDNTMRKRVEIIIIGSPSAIIRQMASRRKDRRGNECITVMDGDQENSCDMFKSQFLVALESCENRDEEIAWFSERMAFLPESIWPERWLIDTLLTININELAAAWRVPTEVLSSYLKEARNAGKHDEFHHLAGNLCLEPENILQASAQCVVSQRGDAFIQINSVLARYIT
ncbi:MAG: ATP-binding protein [Dehalococcoidales bacterium]|nr:ATP-binding protein [Dehalococcoidales bacterium]